MSTFDGNVVEFPDIRIDHFRKDDISRPALAYFLSHVHSDHLIGLETCKSPFVYCSPATREILLRLEKYPHRMNFAKGIIERRVQTYRHLTKLLKPIPLETPTTLELAPGRDIRVTLFDANHCVGAVMFLIEDEKHAIMYTGDIRSEVWWVNSLLRNPILLPYVASNDQAPLKQLDNIYLDTTFASKADPYVQFPSKASGVMELLRQVSKYPPDTLFYFDAWTFGYEDVWQALSTFLDSQIHVDDWRYSVYTSLHLSKESRAPEAFKLIGSQCGNHFQKGCLTTEQSRIHSCEPGTGCSIWNHQFVRITPIISRHNGEDMCEAGAGGGHGDLNQQNELEIDDLASFAELVSLCSDKLKSQPQLLTSVKKMLTDALKDPRGKISLDATELGIGQDDEFADLDDISLEKVVPALAKVVMKSKQAASNAGAKLGNSASSSSLPKQIRFPYSRHSSYSELCLLVEAFKPRNIFPCTADHRGWNPKQSMEYLFGHIYGNKPPSFPHDQCMLQHYSEKPPMILERKRPSPETQDDHEVAIATTREEQAPQRPPSRSSRESRPGTGNERQNAAGERLSRDNSPKRRKPQPQGDFWPPQDLDQYSPRRSKGGSHYSPPAKNDTRKRASSTSQSLEAEYASARSQPWRDDRTEYDEATVAQAKSRSSSRAWQTGRSNDSRRSSVSSSSSTYSAGSRSSQQRTARRRDQRCRQRERQMQWEQQPQMQHHQDEDYGRLSQTSMAMDERPPVRSPKQDSRKQNASKPESSKQDSPQEKSTVQYSSAESTTEWDEAELRLAIQQEAHDAALGIGLKWSEIGLVSIRGHQEVEEEL